MKRFVALLLALIMILSLSATAFADENDGENENPPATKNNSITVNNAVVGQTYGIIRMFDLSVNSETNPTAYSYTVNEEWAAFFAEGGEGAKYVTIDENGYVTAINDVAGLATAAAYWCTEVSHIISKSGVGRSIKATSTTLVFENLDNGYWLIVSSLGTIAMIETTPSNQKVEVNEKNEVPNITKEVKEDSTGNYGKENDAQLGDTIYYVAELTLYPGAKDIIVEDTMAGGSGGYSFGLKYNKDLEIKIGDQELAEENYVLKEYDYSFTITFDQDYLDSIDGKTVLTLTYTAELVANAIYPDSTPPTEDSNWEALDQKNTIVVKYGLEASAKAETVTKTHYVTVNKYADGVENLAGAVFSLKKNGTVVPLVKLNDTTYRVATDTDQVTVTEFVTVDSGDITIWGLDSDEDYTLEEITPPAGYNKLASEVAVEVDAIIGVENNAGTELPSTGGVGTTLFYVFGGILVLASFVLLITKKRMAEMA